MTAHSPLASPRATRMVLERHGLHTKKSFGQHFLIDDGVVGRILEVARPDPDGTVLEVGPGIGTLSVALLASTGALIALERDEDLLPVLAETCADAEGRYAVRKGDALTLAWDEVEMLCAEHGWKVPRMLVANLPYAVAATLILDYFDRFPLLESATVMVQSEVADRILAQPGTKAYGAYTVKLGLRARVTRRFEVNPGCFFPPPRVSSAVIRLERATPSFGQDPEVEDAGITEELIAAAQVMADAAFAQRRKTLRNSLRSHLVSRGCPADAVDDIIAGTGLAPTVRGETLAQGDFLRLGQQLLRVSSGTAGASGTAGT